MDSLIPNGTNTIRPVSPSVFSSVMTWEQMRKAWEAAFLAAKARGETQSTIAQRGGLSGQNVISKMRANRNIGPQVETFVRAIEGLGMRPSEFFLQLERASAHTDASEEKSTEVFTLNSPVTPIGDKYVAPNQERRHVGSGDSLSSLDDRIARYQQQATDYFEMAAALEAQRQRATQRSARKIGPAQPKKARSR